MWGHLEVVEALLAAGASVEAQDNEGPSPRDGSDVTGRTLWEGGARGDTWERHHMTLRLLKILGTSFQESDSVNLGI